MKRRVTAALLVLGLLGLMMGPALLGMVAVLFSAAANAAENPCVSPIGTVPAMGGPVRLPVVGQYQVTSEYGMRYNPGTISTGQYRLHSGLDMAELPGPATVVAPMAGVVQATPSSLTGGNQIVIDHGGGLMTGYLHLTSRSVQVGDKVWPGRPIGIDLPQYLVLEVKDTSPVMKTATKTASSKPAVLRPTANSASWTCSPRNCTNV